MSNKNIKSDVIISYLAMFVALVITFFLTKYQIVYLGKESYGILSLVNSTIGYIAILDLGVGQTVARYIAKYNSEGKIEKINELAGHSFKKYIEISIIALIIGIFIMIKASSIFGSLTIDTESVFKMCFFIALINVVLQIPGATFNAVLKGFGEFRIMKIINIIKSLLRAVLIILLLKLGFNILSVFIVDLFLNQLINLFNYVYMRMKLKIRLDFKPIDRKLKKELSQYSFFVFLGIITDQIFWKSDGIILGVLSTASVVGVYAISGQLLSQFLTMCSTLSSVFLPRIVEKIAMGETKEEINKFFTKASRYQYIFVGMVIISYIFIGKDFITLWLGNNFINAYYYGLIIMISLIVPMFQTTGVQILYAIGRHKFRSIVYLVNAILNIVVSIALFYIIGPVGVAIATSISMLLGNTIIMNIYYKKVLELNLIKFFKEVCLKTSIVMIITAFVYMGLNKILGVGWIQFIAKGSLANVIYLLGVWFITFEKNERKNYSSIIHYKLIRLHKKNL